MAAPDDGRASGRPWSAALYATLDDMRRQGKNENMLRNAYMKYMCWLYYKFERIVNVLGGEALPKILYAGDVSHYELQLLTVLSRAGADIVLLECGGDQAYLTVDPQSAASRLYQAPGLGPFPAGFGVKQLQADLEREVAPPAALRRAAVPLPLHQRLGPEAGAERGPHRRPGPGERSPLFLQPLPLPVRRGGSVSPTPMTCSPFTSP